MKGHAVIPGNAKGEAIGVGGNLPVTGLNDNVEFLGRQLHIQTEYIELPDSHIVTQVFSNGRVLLSRKSEFPPGNQPSRDIRDLQRAMNAQHQRALQEISDKQARALNSRDSTIRP
jgi:hypothetical protein